MKTTSRRGTRSLSRTRRFSRTRWRGTAGWRRCAARSARSSTSRASRRTRRERDARDAGSRRCRSIRENVIRESRRRPSVRRRRISESSERILRSGVPRVWRDARPSPSTRPRPTGPARPWFIAPHATATPMSCVCWCASSGRISMCDARESAPRRRTSPRKTDTSTCFASCARFRGSRAFGGAARRRARNHRRHRRLFVKRRRRPLMTLGSLHSRVRPAERRRCTSPRATDTSRRVRFSSKKCVATWTRGTTMGRPPRTSPRLPGVSRRCVCCVRTTRTSTRATATGGRRFTSRRAVRVKKRTRVPSRARSSWTRRLTKTRARGVCSRATSEATLPRTSRSPRARRWRRRFRCSRRTFS